MPKKRSSNDSTSGSNRSEYIVTGIGNDLITAKGGNDLIFSGSGNDVVHAGAGNDVVFGGSGSDKIDGGAGNDLIFGGSGRDEIDGGKGNDLIFGGTGSDKIDGGAGNDLIFGGSGRDEIDGGKGNDLIFGGTGSDKIDGGAGNDLIFGGSGRDEIDGGKGNDLIFGGTGSDKIDGGAGNDLIFGGSGRDEIDGGKGNDLIFGGTGSDKIDGGAGNDLIFGGSGRDEIDGGKGNDLIFGGTGSDKIDGGAGNDLIFGGSGRDEIDGGKGNDLIFGGTGSDKIDGGAGNDLIFGGSGRDEIDGGKGNDLIFGGSGRDKIAGGAGHDRIFGGSSNDEIHGGAGNDRIYSGSGRDTIDGGAGRDVIFAGSGNDTLIYTLPDTATSNSCWPDYYNGGSGFDTLRINLTTAQTGDTGLVAELSAYLDALDAGTASNYVRLPTLNLAVSSIDAVEVYVDGVLTDIRDIGGNSVVAEDDSFSVGENGELSDSVASNDTVPTGATFTLLSPVTEGTLALNADGTFTYNPDGAYEALAVGETATQEFTYQLSQGGETATATATITITGSNDAPTVATSITATIAENDASSIVDLVQGVSDVDNGTTLSVVNLTGLVAGLTQTGTSLVVDTSNPTIQALAAGETLEISLGYEVVDQHGASVAQTAAITITGANDAPTVSGAITATAIEDAAVLTIELLDNASDIDTGTNLSISNVSPLPAGVTLSGTSLSIDPSHAVFQPLAAGETTDVTVSYDVIDGDGGSVAQTATVSIVGTNDEPTVSAAITAGAEKDTAGFDVELLQFANDVDAGTTLAVENVTGLSAGVTLSGTTLTVDPSDPAFSDIAPGDSREITISFDVIDGDGGSVAQTATITITGLDSNLPPVVTGPIETDVSEDASSGIAIDLLAGASDPDGTAPLTVQNISSLPQGFTLNGTILTVDPSSATYQTLAVGQTREIEISYDIADQFDAVVSQTATITIIGQNDVPEVAAALTGSAVEDGDSLVVELLDGTRDIDSDTNLEVANVSALPDGVTLSGTSLTVDPSHTAFQSLAVGATQDITVTYDVVDGDGGSVAQTATITITGVNDAPEVANAILDTVTEDGTIVTVELLDGASDIDAGTNLDVANVSALPNGVTLSGTSLTVDPSNAAFQSLAAGATQDITVTFDVVDGDGGSVAQTATITITGTNDDPEISAAVTANATEDGVLVTVELLDGASDIDAGTDLDVANVSALPDGVTLSGTSLVVDPSNASFQFLAEGATQNITVTYDVVDGNGGSAAQTATIIVAGTNDAPTVTAALSAAADEDTASFTLDLRTGASDVDNGATLSVQNNSTLVAGVTLAGSILTVNPADAAFQQLAIGETQEILIEYEVVDEHGASVPQSATVTLTGTNDAPTIAGALTAAVDEDDAELEIALLTGASDIDNGTTLSVTNISGLVDGLEQTGNSLTVNPTHSSFQSLAQGEQLDLNVTYDVIDGDGGRISQSLTVTITGTNDTPTVAAALSATAAEDSASITLDLRTGASDVDNGATLSVTNLNGLVPGVTQNGDSLDIDPDHAAFQSLNVGQTQDITITYDVEDEFGAGVPQTAQITITGTNDTPTVDAALETSIDEDASVLTVILLEGASDIDDGSVLNVADVTGMGPGFTLNGNLLEVDPSVAAYQPIALGESVTYIVNYNVVDEHGASIGQSATITINGTNDIPVALGTVDTQFVQTGVAYSMTLAPELFGDVDTSDTLILSASLANGDPLPSWLTFDTTAGTLSGTPNDERDAQLYRVEITATDPHGASATVGYWMGQGDSFLGGVDSTNETISGTNSDGDILRGGEGTDYLVGRSRTDIYVVTADDDLTVIEDNGFLSDDTLLLEGIAPADVTFDRRHPASSDLVISVAGVPLVLALNTLNSSSSDELEFVAFGDGSMVTMADIRATLVSQSETSGADVVAGFEATDTINGGTGNDFLTGMDGADTYVFNAGDGQDVIHDNGFGDTDVVQFVDRSSTDATYSRVPGESSSVLISFANGDSVLLRDGVDDDLYDGIERVEYGNDGVALTIGEIRDILLAQSLTEGDDKVSGLDLAETIEAGLGDDYIDGADGADTYIFNAGDGRDIIDDNGFGDADALVFTDYSLADATFGRLPINQNDVTITFSNGDQVIMRDSFNEDLSGSISQVTFQGTGADEVLTIADVRAIIFAQASTDGNDFINTGSNSLSDTLEAGQGNDYMTAHGGSDTYVFGSSDGRDIIYDGGYDDTDVLDLSDFATTDMTVRFVEGSTQSIVLSFATGEEVTIIDQTEVQGQIENFVFSDGTLTAAEIETLATAGTSPGDVFIGNDLANTLSGNGGYDHLFGGDGADTYVFDVGDGRMEIEDNGDGGGDEVIVNGYSSTHASFEHVEGQSTHLRIVFAGNDEITIRNTLGTSFTDRIENVTFNGDGVTLSVADIRQILVDNQSTAGNDTIYGYAYAETLSGSTGDDFLSGGAGGDTYIFNLGDGNDQILDNGGGGTDRLEINGYDFADATITRIPGTTADIMVELSAGDSLLLADALTGNYQNGIEELVFNGPGGAQTVSMSSVRDLLLNDQSTTGDDVLYGTSNSETLEGGLGDDYLSGSLGGDTYVYTLGDGNDVIYDNGGGAGDVLQLNGISSDSVTVTRANDNSNSVILTMSDGGSVRLENSLPNNYTNMIDEISFVDEGVTWTMEDLRLQILAEQITSGNDDIIGWSTNDALSGNTGNDYLSGGNGTDTYTFNVGDGVDTVFDLGGGGSDEIIFNGRNISEATFSSLHDGSNDLLIEFANGDSVTVRETVSGSYANRIEDYTFDDGTLSHADVVALL